MSRRRYVVIAVVVTLFLLVLILSACNDDNSDGRRAEATGTQVTAASRADQVSVHPIQGAIYAIEVVETLTPSVVQVVTETLAMGTIDQPGPGMGVGTGVILDMQGNILTNDHVIAGAERITVTLSNGESFPAQVIGRDSGTDTAVIRIEASGLQPVKLGRSSELRGVKR